MTELIELDADGNPKITNKKRQKLHWGFVE
jgi:hypothetical protein